MLSLYCSQWNLTDPRKIKSTSTCDIYLVSSNDQPAILKLSKGMTGLADAESVKALSVFNGKGSVKLYKFDEHAQLLEFIPGPMLTKVVHDQGDEQATRIVCGVLNQLHSCSLTADTKFLTMNENLSSLWTIANMKGVDAIYARGAEAAVDILKNQSDVRLLHGDLHHENIMESKDRGWIAIDPKGLIGERAYDVANIFYNPSSLGLYLTNIPTIKKRLQTFTDHLDLDKMKVLQYAFLFGCLRAAWFKEDGDPKNEENSLKIAQSIYTVLTEG